MDMNVVGIRIEKVIYTLSRGIKFFSIFMLFLMMLFVTADVIGRYILNKPIKGDIELQELMMVVIVFLALAYATTMKQHVFMELLVQRLKGRTLAIVDSLASVLGLIFLALVTWRTGVGGWNDLISPTGKHTMLLDIPVAPFIFVADAGLLLMFLVVLCETIRNINRVAKS